MTEFHLYKIKFISPMKSVRVEFNCMIINTHELHYEVLVFSNFGCGCGYGCKESANDCSRLLAFLNCCMTFLLNGNHMMSMVQGYIFMRNWFIL